MRSYFTKKAGAKRSRHQRRPINHDAQDTYQVDKILQVRGKVVGSRKMLIRWTGYNSSHDSWVEECNVSRKAVADFDGEYKNLSVSDVRKVKKGEYTNAFSRLMARNKQVISLHNGKRRKQQYTKSHRRHFKQHRTTKPKPSLCQRTLHFREQPGETMYPEVFYCLNMVAIIKSSTSVNYCPRSLYRNVYETLQMGQLVCDPILLRHEHIKKN